MYKENRCVKRRGKSGSEVLITVVALRLKATDMCEFCTCGWKTAGNQMNFVGN